MEGRTFGIIFFYSEHFFAHFITPWVFHNKKNGFGQFQKWIFSWSTSLPLNKMMFLVYRILHLMRSLTFSSEWNIDGWNPINHPGTISESLLNCMNNVYIPTLQNLKYLNILLPSALRPLIGIYFFNQFIIIIS